MGCPALGVWVPFLKQPDAVPGRAPLNFFFELPLIFLLFFINDFYFLEFFKNFFFVCYFEKKCPKFQIQNFKIKKKKN
jgi:hypothetical protein